MIPSLLLIGALLLGADADQAPVETDESAKVADESTGEPAKPDGDSSPKVESEAKSESGTEAEAPADGATAAEASDDSPKAADDSAATVETAVEETVDASVDGEAKGEAGAENAAGTDSVAAAGSDSAATVETAVEETVDASVDGEAKSDTGAEILDTAAGSDSVDGASANTDDEESIEVELESVPKAAAESGSTTNVESSDTDNTTGDEASTDSADNKNTGTGSRVRVADLLNQAGSSGRPYTLVAQLQHQAVASRVFTPSTQADESYVMRAGFVTQLAAQGIYKLSDSLMAVASMAAAVNYARTNYGDSNYALAMLPSDIKLGALFLQKLELDLSRVRLGKREIQFKHRASILLPTSMVSDAADRLLGIQGKTQATVALSERLTVDADAMLLVYLYHNVTTPERTFAFISLGGAANYELERPEGIWTFSGWAGWANNMLWGEARPELGWEGSASLTPHPQLTVTLSYGNALSLQRADGVDISLADSARAIWSRDTVYTGLRITGSY